MFNLNKVSSLILAVLLLGASQTSAALIVADHFTVTYGDTGLFGPLHGSASSSQIDAHPNAFIAQTVGVGIFSAAASAPMLVQANAGYQLDRILFVAAGDYSYFKFSPSGNVGVAVSGQVNPIGTLDNYTSPLNVVSPFLANMAFDFNTQDWVANAAVTLPHGITSAWVTWQKLLFSFSDQTLGAAFIENKFDAIRVDTSLVSQIPEPPRSWLMMVSIIYFLVRKPEPRSHKKGRSKN